MLGIRDEPLISAIATASCGHPEDDRDLSTLAWAIATLQLPNEPLLDAVAQSLLAVAPDSVRPQSLANCVWAFAALSVNNAPLILAMASRTLALVQLETRSISGPPLGIQGMLTNLNAVGWALNFVGLLSPNLDRDIYSLLLELAKVRDDQLKAQLQNRGARQPLPLPPRHVFLEQGADPDVLATVVLDLPEVCVVHKPPGWEVDCADVGSGILLSSFLQHLFTVDEAPLMHFQEHQYGMVHRLDRVSSGLLLVGKTFVGYHAMCWQLNTGRLEREYVVVAHGWLDPAIRLIDAKVLHVHADGGKESQVCDQGKPSQTRVTTLGHFTLKSDMKEHLSLVVIQIRTGRRHQIRAHMAHIGHPTVTDGKYSTHDIFCRDRQWCARNFLHRYRLSFSDLAGNKHEAVASLPDDLRAAMENLVAQNDCSAEHAEEWSAGHRPSAWATYAGLGPPRI